MQAPGLYVHVPFCASRCRYCAFASGTELGLRPTYLEGLAREVTRCAPRWSGFDTLYLGGGTPTVLGLAGLERLVLALAPLDIAPGADRCVEANPDDCTADLLRGLRALGFTRLSLGVQALDDGALRLLGRRHDAASARRAVALARSAGFEDLSLDLIYARPGQGIEGWLRELEGALALGPDHLSCYELSLEEGTPLARAVAVGELALPGEEAAAEFYVAGSRLLRARGFVHYEVSSYARSVGRRSRHNLKYWSGAPYLGLGPGAHSFDGALRWWNPPAVEPWADRLARGLSASAGHERLDAAALRLERLALGLRHRGGVALRDLAGHEALLRRAVEEGQLEIDGDRARPTPEGMLVADGLARRFA